MKTTPLLTALGLSTAMIAINPAANAGSCNSGHAQATTASLRSSSSPNIVETAVSAGKFNTLAAALQAADLVDALQTEGPFTVFAPTDEAFAKLPAGTVEMLLKPENRDTLAAILTYHVVPGQVMAADVVTLETATTLNGQRIDIKTSDKGVKIDGATVIKTDIACSNGVIHVIDQVILPSTDDIVDTAMKAGSFTTLAAAVKTAGLVQTLQGDGPFTVFAPTDAAFAKLPDGTVEALLKPENRHKLVEILTYHVVPGRVYASDAAAAQRAKTVQGSLVSFSLVGGQLRIDNAAIIATDLDTTNGVIHVIDEVILPSDS